MIYMVIGAVLVIGLLAVLLYIHLKVNFYSKHEVDTISQGKCPACHTPIEIEVSTVHELLGNGTTKWERQFSGQCGNCPYHFKIVRLIGLFG